MLVKMSGTNDDDNLVIGTSIVPSATTVVETTTTDVTQATTASVVTVDSVFAVSTMKERLDDLLNRKEAARNAGSERSVERQHAKGKMLARERIDYLLDPGSFHELDMLAATVSMSQVLKSSPHRRSDHGLGTVDGRKVFVFSQDFTVFGGTRRGVRREDSQGDGPCPIDRCSNDRSE